MWFDTRTGRASAAHAMRRIPLSLPQICPGPAYWDELEF
jgi:hypothetical protein